MNVVLINPYELGRQPFALAHPTAWLKESGHKVLCLDLSLQQLDGEILGDADLIGVYVGIAQNFTIERYRPGLHLTTERVL